MWRYGSLWEMNSVDAYIVWWLCPLGCFRAKTPLFLGLYSKSLELDMCLFCNFLRCWYQFSISEGLKLFHLLKRFKATVYRVSICIKMAKSNTFFTETVSLNGHVLHKWHMPSLDRKIYCKMLYTICPGPSINSCSFRLTNHFLNPTKTIRPPK